MLGVSVRSMSEASARPLRHMLAGGRTVVYQNCSSSIGSPEGSESCLSTALFVRLGQGRYTKALKCITATMMLVAGLPLDVDVPNAFHIEAGVRTLARNPLGVTIFGTPR